MRPAPGSLLDVTNRNIVRRQEEYGAQRGFPWGVSESAYNVRDLEFTYQYSTFDNQILATTDLANLFFPSGISVGRNGNVPQETIQKKHQFRDDLSWIRGKHGFKFGGDFVWEPTLGGVFAFSSAPSYEFIFDPGDIALNPAQFPQGFKTHQVLPGNITYSPDLGAKVGPGLQFGLQFSTIRRRPRRADPRH